MCRAPPFGIRSAFQRVVDETACAANKRCRIHPKFPVWRESIRKKDSDSPIRRTLDQTFDPFRSIFLNFERTIR